jgi:hypothetical protein
MEGSCEYIGLTVADSRQGGVPPAWGFGMGLRTPRRKKVKCYETFRSASDLD